MPQFCAKHEAKAVYKPILLGGVFKATGNRAPMIRYADAPAKLAYEQLEFRRFIEANAILAFRMSPHFPANALLAMRTIAGVQNTPAFAEAIDAMLRGMREYGIDLGQHWI